MPPTKRASFNLSALASRAAAENGFATDTPPWQATDARSSGGDGEVRDLRSLLWSSIDNAESRDLDQVEYAARESDGEIRLLVGIADVDAFVLRDSRIDAHAAGNTTSLYTGVAVFPMLPVELSNDLTSLLPQTDRLAVVMEFVIAEDGAITAPNVFRATVRNGAKLDYESVGAWLEGRGPAPDELVRSRALEEQLRLQDEARGRLREFRRRSGALEFESIEARPVVVAGRVVDLHVAAKNRARELIECFMVAANGAMAGFLSAHGSPMIQRIVRTPKRWDRIAAIAASFGTSLPTEPNSPALAEFLATRKEAAPERFAELSLAIVKLLGPGEYAVLRPGGEAEGHFGLAVHDYTHATAPNRRYVDLVTQRLVKAALRREPPPYSDAELIRIAEHCNERAHAARKLERFMRKAAAAALLAARIGESFDGIITGATPKGVFVRLLAPAAEGRVVRGEHGLDVGERVRARLLSTDPERGFIGFERLG